MTELQKQASQRMKNVLGQQDSESVYTLEEELRTGRSPSFACKFRINQGKIIVRNLDHWDAVSLAKACDRLGYPWEYKHN